MALVTDIADAVVTELAGGSFSQSFTAARKVMPIFELSDLADLKVSVVPRGVEITGASRSLVQHDVQVDIGIQKKLSAGGGSDAEVVSLLTLVEEIAEFLKRRPLAATPWAIWVRTANEPVYAPDHLAEKRLFTSVLTLTYRILK